MQFSNDPIPFSPSSLMAFSKCERRWVLERTLRPSVLSKANMSAYVGLGVAKGMEQYHRDEISRELHPVEYYASLAAQEAQCLALKDLKDGCTLPGSLMPEYALVGPRAGTATGHLVTHQPLLVGFETIAAELVLEEWGNARIDLVVDSLDGLMIVDYKTKISTTPYMLAKTQAEYEFSHQMYFYAIALRSLGYNIEAFTIAMCVIEPKPKTHIWPFMLDERILKEYEQTFRLLSEKMQRVRETGDGAMALAHNDQYGECPWKAYCLLDYTQYAMPRKIISAMAQDESECTTLIQDTTHT